MYKKFKSLTPGSEYSYCYDSSAFDTNAPIDMNFRQFYTYGDGLTAHSPSWAIQKEFIGDYLASLAEAMLSDEELALEVSYRLSRRPSLEQIEFAASVVYKAPKDPKDVYIKRRYFSAKEMAISSSPAKEHDKRYEEIRENVHDGSPKSIFRILVPEYADGLQRYLYAEAIREWAMPREGMWMEAPWEFLKWTEDREKGRAIGNALLACQSIAESYRLKHTAESALANYKRSIQPKELPKEVEEIAEHLEQGGGQ